MRTRSGTCANDAASDRRRSNRAHRSVDATRDSPDRFVRLIRRRSRSMPSVASGGSDHIFFPRDFFALEKRRSNSMRRTPSSHDARASPRVTARRMSDRLMRRARRCLPRMSGDKRVHGARAVIDRPLHRMRRMIDTHRDALRSSLRRHRSEVTAGVSIVFRRRKPETTAVRATAGNILKIRIF